MVANHCSNFPGTLTCGGFAGSLGFEEIDAKTWTEWGIDCKFSPHAIWSASFLKEKLRPQV